MLLDLVNATTALTENDHDKSSSAKATNSYKTVSDYLEQASEEMTDRFETLRAFMMALGDDVQMNTLKNYFAFKRIKNFACVEIHPQTKCISVYVKVNPDPIQLESSFTRDVRQIGHYGTGDLEITIMNDDQLERAKELIQRSYELS